MHRPNAILPNPVVDTARSSSTSFTEDKPTRSTFHRVGHDPPFPASFIPVFNRSIRHLCGRESAATLAVLIGDSCGTANALPVESGTAS